MTFQFEIDVEMQSNLYFNKYEKLSYKISTVILNRNLLTEITTVLDLHTDSKSTSKISRISVQKISILILNYRSISSGNWMARFKKANTVRTHTSI